MNLTSFGIDNAIKEYCSGVVDDVIDPDCTSGVYITSHKPLISDGIGFFVVEITFYYASIKKYEKSYQLIMYQQNLNRIDIVRAFHDYASCLTAFNAVNYTND